MDHTSIVDLVSAVCPGVSYQIRKMSFARRLALLRTVRGLTSDLERFSAGSSVADQADTAIAQAEITRAYIEWGLESVEGLRIDGEPATTAALIERGPEVLCREIAAHIRRECFLSEDERKN